MHSINNKVLYWIKTTQVIKTIKYRFTSNSWFPWNCWRSAPLLQKQGWTAINSWPPVPVLSHFQLTHWSQKFPFKPSLTPFGRANAFPFSLPKKSVAPSLGKLSPKQSIVCTKKMSSITGPHLQTWASKTSSKRYQKVQLRLEQGIPDSMVRI